MESPDEIYQAKGMSTKDKENKDKGKDYYYDDMKGKLKFNHKRMILTV